MRLFRRVQVQSAWKPWGQEPNIPSHTTFLCAFVLTRAGVCMPGRNAALNCTGKVHELENVVPICPDTNNWGAPRTSTNPRWCKQNMCVYVALYHIIRNRLRRNFNTCNHHRSIRYERRFCSLQPHETQNSHLKAMLVVEEQAVHQGQKSKATIVNYNISWVGKDIYI